jgi:PAS domain S-box-containing protein
MAQTLSQPPMPKRRASEAPSIDTMLEEYLSKLEQKVLTQTMQLQAITDNASSCLFLIDDLGRATFMNPSAQRITGYALEEIHDQPLHRVLHPKHADGEPADRCWISLALEKFRLVRDREDVFYRKDGTAFPASCSVAPLEREGHPWGAVLEFQDITQRKELERQKDDFIGVASHELKTPVTSMKTYTQVLQRQFQQRGDIKAVESLTKINAQIERLSALISDLLDVTRIQTGNLSFQTEEFSLVTLIEEITETMQLTTDRHHLEVDLSGQSSVRADRDRTGQVLINLISNAIKYSPHSDRIIIRAQSGASEVMVSVQDFGIGIPAEKQDQVFERFSRISGPRMETFPGLGLGLYISAQIIRRLGGRIWVDSAEGQGSTFYFTLPLATTATVKRPADATGKEEG